MIYATTLTSTHQIFSGINDPRSPTLFAQKIVANHYLSLGTFVSSVISHQHWDHSRQRGLKNEDKFDVEVVEQVWSDIQSWERRLNEYCSDIDDLMIKLGIRFQEPEPDLIHTSSWHDTETDFQFMRVVL